MGFIVPRYKHSAVDRNRLKRRLRELVRDTRGVTGVPESYLIGPEGVVRAKIIGGIDAGNVGEVLSQALRAAS